MPGIPLFRRLLHTTVLALAGGALLPVVVEAILVAPHAVFMDHRTRAGQMYLVNSGTVPEEVAIEFMYGFPDSDSAGGVTVRLIEHPDSSQPSAAAWIRAFPRRTVVQPGERQAVRILAQPPLGLADGEYWSRIIVTSREVRPAAVGPDTIVRAGVDVELRTILSLTYRKGQVATGVALTEFRPALTRDSLIVWLGLERHGNGAFLGSVQLDLRSPQGLALGTFDSPMAVYFTVRRRLAFAVDSLAAGGPYAVRLRVSTDRTDLPSTDVLRAPAIVDSALVNLGP